MVRSVTAGSSSILLNSIPSNKLLKQLSSVKSLSQELKSIQSFELFISTVTNEELIKGAISLSPGLG